MAVSAADVRNLVETDVTDGTLDRLIADAEALVDVTVGPDGATLTVERSGDGQTVLLPRPADLDEDLTVSVSWRVGQWDEAGEDVYEVGHGGRLLRHRSLWPRRVRVTYTPKPLGYRRDRVVVDLVHLAVTYNGMAKTESIGDYSAGGSLMPDAYEAERQKLASSLVDGVL